MRRLTFLTLAPLFALSLATPAPAQDVETQYPRVTQICFDPIVKSIPQRPRLSSYKGWYNPYNQMFEYLNYMHQATHDIVQERLTNFIWMDFFPVKADGFQYTEAEYLASQWHLPDAVDYNIIVRDYDLARKVDRGEIDEVKINGGPYFGYYESRFGGRGGYWLNSPALLRVACSRLFVMMGWNYERSVSLHATGHRAESTMTEVYDGWDTNGNRTIWDRFGWNIGQTTVSNIYGIGSAHLPPNGDDHYDYGNPQTVQSYAPDWMNNFPNFTDEWDYVSRNTWGGPNWELNFFIWWYQHMPHVAGSNTHDGYHRLNNWWEYIFNYNAHAESGGDHLEGGTPPPATPYDQSPVTLESDTRDDWAPVANTAGVIAWYGHDGNDFEVYADLGDGTGITQITNNVYNDQDVQINDNGQLVWQMFDGQDYEVFTANADGTGLTQITDNEVNDWHADISNTGRIVWDRWDGSDYEIFSAMADGTDVVQVTNRSSSGMTRYDDQWPRINNNDRVVWMGSDGYDLEIYSANADGTDSVRITTNSYKDEFPQINDQGYVVWHVWHSSVDAEIYAADAHTGATTRITSDSTEDWWPQINNDNRIVWMSRAGTDWEIKASYATGGAITAITSNGQHDQYPQIHADGAIVWQGFDGHDWEIYAQRDDVIYQVTDNDYDDWWPQFGGDGLITWHAESAPGAEGPTTDIFYVGGPPDETPPTLVDAVAADPTTVMVTFSEPLDPTTAEDVSHYVLSDGASVIAAALQGDAMTVVLTTSTLVENTTYTLAVSDVQDLADPPNTIAPGSEIEFTVVIWDRVSAGLVVLYSFLEGSGATVHDVSNVGTPLDLTVADPENVTWTPQGLRIDIATELSNGSGATKIYDACTATSEVTIEAWIVPTLAAQGGPANIISMSVTSSSHNFRLAHGDAGGSSADVYTGWLRTNEDDWTVSTPGGAATTDLTHLVCTRDVLGNLAMYKDGSVIATEAAPGSFSTWNNGYRLLLGNEYIGSTPWLGEYQLVAIYDRALDPNEVEQNYLAGVGSAPSDCVGDCNCDGERDYFDINYFLEALGGESQWAQYYRDQNGGADPPCAFIPSCDPDGDGDCDYFDINPFIDLLGEPCP